MTLSARRVLIVGLITLGVGLLSLFIYSRVQVLLSGPEINLVEPKDGEKTEEGVIHFAGIITHATSTSINGRILYLDQEGNFKETIVLEPGYNITIIRAEDRFGKVKEVKREIVRISNPTPVSAPITEKEEGPAVPNVEIQKPEPTAL